MKQKKAERKNFIFVTEYNCSSNNNISVLENKCVTDKAVSEICRI